MASTTRQNSGDAESKRAYEATLSILFRGNFIKANLNKPVQYLGCKNNLR